MSSFSNNNNGNNYIPPNDASNAPLPNTINIPSELRYLASKEQYNFNFNTWPVSDTLGINLQEQVSLKMARKILGRGVNATSEDKKINKYLQQLDSENNFFNFLYNLCKWNSIFGYSIILMSRLKNNKIVWNFSNPLDFNFEMIGEELISLTQTAQISTGNNSINMNVVLDKKTSKISYSGITEKEKLLGYSESEENHNFGFVPAVIFKNLPTKTLFNLPFSTGFSDTQSTKGLQAQFNIIAEKLFYETQYNITRIFIRLSLTDWSKLVTKTKQGEKGTYNLFKNNGIIIIPSADANFTNGTLNTWLETTAGNPQLDTYLNALEKIKNMYYESAGLSTDNEDSIVQSATEVQFNNSSDNETIILKRNILKKYFIELLIKSILMKDNTFTYEKLKQNITVQINENIGIDRQQILSEELQKLQFGLTSKIEILMKLEGITRQEATEKYNKIQNDLILEQSMNNLVDTENEQINNVE